MGTERWPQKAREEIFGCLTSPACISPAGCVVWREALNQLVLKQEAVLWVVVALGVDRDLYPWVQATWLLVSPHSVPWGTGLWASPQRSPSAGQSKQGMG